VRVVPFFADSGSARARAAVAAFRKPASFMSESTAFRRSFASAVFLNGEYTFGDGMSAARSAASLSVSESIGSSKYQRAASATPATPRPSPCPR
jgi:hypothetical protein